MLNGDVIPVLQSRIYDASFDKIALTPLGAIKVFIRTIDGGDVGTLLSEAVEFFDNFFSKPVPWNKDALVRERGAWVCIYGVPLHAWNIDFFKLCVLDCGRLLRVDDITLDRDRFDYARILLSTSSLEIIKTEACIMIDGVLFDFQIIEEWGFALGEDACLFDDEEGQDVDSHECPDIHDDVVACGDFDALVNHLTTDFEEEVSKHATLVSSHGSSNVQNVALNTPSPSATSLPQGETLTMKVQAAAACSFFDAPVVFSKNNLAQTCDVVVKNRSRDPFVVEKRKIKRTTSCPPGRVASSMSGPWSLEWVNKHKSFIQWVHGCLIRRVL